MSHTLIIKTASMTAKLAETTVVYASEGLELAGAAETIWKATGLDLASLCKTARFAGRQGQVLDVLAPPGITAERLLVLGMGKRDDDLSHTPNGFRDRGGSLVAKLLGARAEKVSVIADGMDPRSIAELAAGMRMRAYRFDKYKSSKEDHAKQEGETLAVTLHVENKAEVDKAIADRMATVEGTLFARELVNEPPNILGPVEFAEAAGTLADLGVTIEVLTPKDMEKLGMGALLAVAKGSVRPARMVVMQWHGGRKKDAPVAFVGKGVVFDTGGISLKRAGSMEDMKGDMGGAAAVTGLMKTLATRKARANVVGVIGIVENMPDGNAYRPGDILKSMSGQTIEVVNTDAEGRLVLADALWYTQDRFKPKFMINLATLTGAIMVGLGHEYAGLFSNNDELATNLFNCGLSSGEKVWRMPMGPAYDKLIESRFADMKNSGGMYGGSITAAQLLQRFVNDTPWAHLDIAGAAFGGPSSEANVSWATGFGVALLDRLVRDHCE